MKHSSLSHKNTGSLCNEELYNCSSFRTYISKISTTSNYCNVIYRPTVDTVIKLLKKLEPPRLEVEAAVSDELLEKKTGFFGSKWYAVLSLLSMRITVDIDGRSAGSSCTQSNPTWIHFKTSVWLHDSLSDGSMSSNALSSFHNLHAYIITSYQILAS